MARTHRLCRLKMSIPSSNHLVQQSAALLHSCPKHAHTQDSPQVCPRLVSALLRHDNTHGTQLQHESFLASHAHANTANQNACAPRMPAGMRYLGHEHLWFVHTHNGCVVVLCFFGGSVSLQRPLPHGAPVYVHTGCPSAPRGLISHFPLLSRLTTIVEPLPLSSPLTRSILARSPLARTEHPGTEAPYLTRSLLTRSHSWPKLQ